MKENLVKHKMLLFYGLMKTTNVKNIQSEHKLPKQLQKQQSANELIAKVLIHAYSVWNLLEKFHKWYNTAPWWITYYYTIHHPGLSRMQLFNMSVRKLIYWNSNNNNIHTFIYNL